MKRKYSDWFKVDLHIHTDFSNKTKNKDYEGKFDLQVLKQKLINNVVKLFSLTDHNIINVKAYEDYYSSFVEGDPVLLLGCEFDIEVEQEDKSNKHYHTLLIFNEETTLKVQEVSDIIENHFFKKGKKKLKGV
jgi:hypothetical protein